MVRSTSKHVGVPCLGGVNSVCVGGGINYRKLSTKFIWNEAVCDCFGTYGRVVSLGGRSSVKVAVAADGYGIEMEFTKVTGEKEPRGQSKMSSYDIDASQ